MKKTSISGKKRELLLFTERILVVIFAVCITLIFTNSFFNISTSYGTTYYYVASPLEQERAFEDKEIFRELLKGNMEQITRYVVIRDQLESKGSYDANKVIDVTEYANRTGNLLTGQPVAEFYLDDLITWGNYGFTYQTVVGTWEELNALFLGKVNSEVKSEEITEEEVPDVNNIKKYKGTIRENAQRLEEDNTDNDKYAMEILVPRYKTIEGKDLMECASNVEEYEILKANLITAANELFSNYTEYVLLQQQYSAEKTNISYCYQVMTESGIQYYTNSEFDFQGKTEDEISSFVKETDSKFIYFNPDKVQISTNTDISAK